MNYPNYKNKHLEKSLFSPHDFFNYVNIKKIKNLPKKYILIFDNRCFKYLKKKYSKDFKNLASITSGKVFVSQNLGFVKVNGIGAPNAVIVMEELIELGGKEFIILGMAGGLRNFGLYVCNKAIRDEGTSHHYIKLGKYSYPNKNLTQKLESILKDNSIGYKKGTTWTIDAPYRETKKEILYYKKEGVVTVEMEASALFIVAKVRKVKAAAAFIVSDVLGEKKWDPQFDSKKVCNSLNKLVEVVIKNLI